MARATVKKANSEQNNMREVWNGMRIIMDHEKEEMKCDQHRASEFNLFFNRFDDIASVHPPSAQSLQTCQSLPFPHPPPPDLITPLPTTTFHLTLIPESLLNDSAGFCPFTCLPAPLPHWCSLLACQPLSPSLQWMWEESFSVIFVAFYGFGSRVVKVCAT